MKIDKIGIVGSGHVGGNLGIMLAKAGYDICFSSRHPESLDPLVKAAGPNTRAASVLDTIAFGDVVILSVPLKAIPEFGPDIKNALQDKIVIDTSNPYYDRDGEVADEAKEQAGGMGVFVSQLLPGAKIARAFNTVYFEQLKKRVNSRGQLVGVPIAADDKEAMQAAIEIVQAVGLDPVVVGDLNMSELFDVGTAVYATGSSAQEIRNKLHLKADIAA